MPDPPSSAIRRALATELRRLREACSMSGDDVAARLNWSASKVSRIETNRIGIKPADLTQLLDLYAVDDARRSELRALAAVTEARGWWSAYTDTLPAEYVAYIALENSATTLRAWSPELVHGLLQTEAYAAAVLDAFFGTRILPGDMRRRIEARLRRQALLTRADAAEFTFILDEAALRHRFGTSATMRAQLDHLEQQSRLPTTTIRVLPFAGPHPAGLGGFAILSFAPVRGTRLNDVVYAEHLAGANLLDDETETDEHELAFRRLDAAALDADASRALILSVARDQWS
jgi:transcriptional regulator with XRE-family HTH domain